MTLARPKHWKRGNGLKPVRKTERGWAGHFIVSTYCLFRRNTLLECGTRRVVVSTVGNYRPRPIENGAAESIGSSRHYETMVFRAKYEAPYWEADTARGELSFDANWRLEGVRQESDQKANDMHEAVVAEFTTRLAKGKKL